MLTKIITKQNIRVNPFSVGEGTAEERVGARRGMVRR